MGTAWLTCTNVEKSFGATIALRGVSLSVMRGEIVALLGGNGAGKTTLIELAVGFARRDAGTLLIAGVDPDVDPLAARAHAAYLPETIALYDTLTARETITYFRALNGLARLDRGAIAAQCAEVALSPDALDRPLGEFSKGMRQKVALAVALSRRVDGMLLDEPTTGLDPAAIQDLAATLRRSASRGMGVLIATHDLNFVAALADRAVVMQHGRIRDEMQPDASDGAALAAFYTRSLRATT